MEPEFEIIARFEIVPTKSQTRSIVGTNFPIENRDAISEKHWKF